MTIRIDSKPGSAAAVTIPQVRKVVVIDDSEIVLELTRITLERDGFSVVTCNSPIGSTLVVAREKPDLVLVDVDMASMNGARVVAGIKSGPRTSQVPVYFYSDRNAGELDALTRASGADGYIVKNGDSRALIRQVRQAIGR